MNLQEKYYSVLVVSAPGKIYSGLSQLLSESSYEPVKHVPDVNSAKRTFNERPYDFVIINAPLPDDFGYDFAVDAGNSRGTAVLMLVPSALHDELYEKVYRNGIFTLPKPTSRYALSTALRWLASARENQRKTEAKELTVEEKIKEIRLVNRAKWVLISERGMTEPEAHRYIEKQAMDKCVTRGEISEQILRGSTG